MVTIREKTVSVVNVLKMISELTVDDKEIVLKALQESIALKLSIVYYTHV